jgi:hypothetical protein
MVLSSSHGGYAGGSDSEGGMVGTSQEEGEAICDWIA